MITVVKTGIMATAVVKRINAINAEMLNGASLMIQLYIKLPLLINNIIKRVKATSRAVVHFSSVKYFLKIVGISTVINSPINNVTPP